MSHTTRAVLVPVGLAGTLVVAALALGRIYHGDVATRLVAGAALGAVAISVAARRLPAWTVAPVSVAALAGYALLAVRLSATAGGVPGPVRALAVDALRNGIPRLLTAALPIEPQPDTVVVPVLAAWLAGLAGAELAVRARRVLLGLVPPALCYGGVLVVVGPNARPALWQPLAFAACATVALVASAARRTAGAPSEPVERAVRGRLVLATGGALLTVAALVVAAAPAVAHRVTHVPADPRRYVTPPHLDSLDENPLVRLSGWALNPDQKLLDVRLDGQHTDDTRIRLAVLNDYDGVTWRVGATYRSMGRVLTGPPAQAQPTGPELTQRITVDDLDGRLLPAVAVPQEVDGVRVAFDAASGTVAYPQGLHPGLTYRVASREPHVNENLLNVAEAPSGPTVARWLSLGPGLPPDLRRLADQLTEGAGGAFLRASAVEQFLAQHYQLVADAPSGHAYPNLDFFLFGSRDTGGQRGTSEQFAASFAVLGRAMGLPTRVVVGFRAHSGTVRGADAFAWPEVLLDGLGWYPFNPLPQPDTPPRPVEDDFKPKPDPSTPPPTVVPTPSVAARPTPSHSSAPPAATAGHGSAAGRVAAGTGTGVVLVVVAFVVVVVLLRRAHRRRRLYAGDPPHRITGAWLEVLDALRLAGRPAPPHLSASEVADHAAAAAGDRTLVDDLAGLVNVATFAPDAPTDDDARRAAGQAVAYVGELRARRPWWRRLMWTADPRPLRWYRVRSGAVPGQRGPGSPR